MSDNTIVRINQKVAILIDGKNIEKSVEQISKSKTTRINFDTLVPKLLGVRSLTQLVYFREGEKISAKLADRLHGNFYGIVRPCHKSADIPLTIEAVQLVDKVDTIIILSGDSDYIELVKHLKGRGIRVEVASFGISTANSLKEIIDFYYEITEEDFFNYKP